MTPGTLNDHMERAGHQADPTTVEMRDEIAALQHTIENLQAVSAITEQQNAQLRAGIHGYIADIHKLKEELAEARKQIVQNTVDEVIRDLQALPVAKPVICTACTVVENVYGIHRCNRPAGHVGQKHKCYMGDCQYEWE
jgi:predicted  nucleic acid-binding Zn-ribbon protein